LVSGGYFNGLGMEGRSYTLVKNVIIGHTPPHTHSTSRDTHTRTLKKVCSDNLIHAIQRIIPPYIAPRNIVVPIVTMNLRDTKQKSVNIVENRINQLIKTKNIVVLNVINYQVVLSNEGV